MITDILQEVTISCLQEKVGGPFGAVIYKDGKIVAKGVNRVVGDNDPTAHAEMVAIRNACKELNTFDLTDCVIYATGYPCPMCMSAIVWANIKTVYYAATYEDANSIGFRDSHIFNFLKNNCSNPDILKLIPTEKELILDLYKKFLQADTTRY